MINSIGWPLMQDNITREDVNELVHFLMSIDPRDDRVPRLTQGPQVAAFEREFAAWLGVKHAVMVNSGASANLITVAALAKDGRNEILVPAITWVSDIAAVIHAGYTPIFVDIDPRTLGMEFNQADQQMGDATRALFITHCLGFNALNALFIKYAAALKIPILEDCCESIGARWQGRKLGAFALMSNFSFYYAHHMTTIEGGMVCTDDDVLYQRLRRLRAHGMAREMDDGSFRYEAECAAPTCHPEFIFMEAAYNARSTELNAVLGRAQLKRLDSNVARRTENLATFLAGLDGDKYRTDYAIEGSSNYALPLVLAQKDKKLFTRVCAALDQHGCEYRRGTAGGGNQLRQPYLRTLPRAPQPESCPEADHVHFFGLYLGNFHTLEGERIEALCKVLNAL